MGTVYLLHFQSKIGNKLLTHGHAQHYIGYTNLPVDERVQRHLMGDGAAIVRYVSKQGLPIVIVRLWPNVTRAFERKLKQLKNAPRLCPICSTQSKIVSICGWCDKDKIVTKSSTKAGYLVSHAMCKEHANIFKRSTE